MAEEKKQMFVRKYKSHAEMKADAYRYWQSRPVEERMDAVSELTTAAYALKGIQVESFQRVAKRLAARNGGDR